MGSRGQCWSVSVVAKYVTDKWTHWSVDSQNQMWVDSDMQVEFYNRALCKRRSMVIMYVVLLWGFFETLPMFGAIMWQHLTITTCCRLSTTGMTEQHSLSTVCSTSCLLLGQAISKLNEIRSLLSLGAVCRSLSTLQLTKRRVLKRFFFFPPVQKQRDGRQRAQNLFSPFSPGNYADKAWEIEFFVCLFCFEMQT